MVLGEEFEILACLDQNPPKVFEKEVGMGSVTTNFVDVWEIPTKTNPNLIRRRSGPKLFLIWS